MASSHLKEVYPKTGRSGTMVFTVWETTFTNQDGGGGGRRAGILRIQGVTQAMADRNGPFFEDMDLGDEIGPVELVATDENVATFCELWGNPMPNPVHQPGNSRKVRSARPHSPGCNEHGHYEPGPYRLGRTGIAEGPGPGIPPADTPQQAPAHLRHRNWIPARRDGENLVECDVLMMGEAGERYVGGTALISLPSSGE